MLTRDHMSGLYVLVITPFDKSDSLDEDRLRDNVRLLLSLGVDGIITNYPDRLIAILKANSP